MRSLIRLVIASLALGANVLLPCTTWAQEHSPAAEPRTRVALEEVVLRDGSRLYGKVEERTDTDLAFRTWAGVPVRIPLADVVSVRRVDGWVGRGEFWRADPNRTRLFFAPTGRSLRQKEVSFGVYEFFMPFVQVGVTDRLSVGGGTPLVFGLSEGDRPFWVTPKLQVFASERAHVAIGTMHVFTPNDEGGGIAYVTGTLDRREGSVTAGYGRIYTGFDGGGHVVMVGGEAQVARNIKLLTENYMWKSDSGLLSGGLRFFGERLSADIGLVIPVGTRELFAFPVVNFVYVF